MDRVFGVTLPKLNMQHIERKRYKVFSGNTQKMSFSMNKQTNPMAKTIVDSLHLLCNLTCFITFNSKALTWMKLTHLLRISQVNFLLFFSICLPSSIVDFLYIRRSSEIKEKKYMTYVKAEKNLTLSTFPSLVKRPRQ